jgi:UDP-2-acetamido-3-amino-2,3-dideoxy-glucuronate N-acetyltransferase
MVGVPARQRGWMCSCGIKLSQTSNTAVCPECGKKYRLTQDSCEPIE